MSTLDVPRRIWVTDRASLAAVLELVRSSFASMDGVVEPASSIHRLTIDDLAAGPGEVWAIGDPPVASVVLTPETDALYIGKLAVADEARGTGLARALVETAAGRARDLGLAWLELQTRIELTANHEIFAAMGFEETARTAHAGYRRPTSITFRRAVDPP